MSDEEVFCGNCGRAIFRRSTDDEWADVSTHDHACPPTVAEPPHRQLLSSSVGVGAHRLIGDGDEREVPEYRRCDNYADCGGQMVMVAASCGIEQSHTEKCDRCGREVRSGDNAKVIWPGRRSDGRYFE